MELVTSPSAVRTAVSSDRLANDNVKHVTFAKFEPQNGGIDVDQGRIVKRAPPCRATTRFQRAACEWDAYAISEEHIDSARGSIHGISFTSVVTDNAFMCGLTGPDTHLVRAEGCDFAACCFSDATFRVYTRGDVCAGNFGTYAPGDIMGVVINHDGRCEFRVNGQVRYVSSYEPQYPLRVCVRGLDHGPLMKDLQWISRDGWSTNARTLRPQTAESWESPFDKSPGIQSSANNAVGFKPDSFSKTSASVIAQEDMVFRAGADSSNQLTLKPMQLEQKLDPDFQQAQATISAEYYLDAGSKPLQQRLAMLVKSQEIEELTWVGHNEPPSSWLT